MALVHGQEYYTESCPPSRETERHRGRRIASDEGQNRLDAVSKDFPQNKPEAGATTSGPVCIQTNDPTPALCKLATGPGSNGMRCIQPGLVSNEGLPEPPMEPNRQSPISSPVTTDVLGDCHTTMEITTMVPSTTGHDNRNSTPSPREERPHTTDSQSQPTGHNTTTSRVDYLRERYRDKCLSGEASQLLLASWTPKSSKSYDSLFTKWASWCNKRGTDPVSGVVSEVVNFLAHLFNEGYQYRSLNSYRSAISSVHEKVDGHSVGEHPLVSRVLKGAFHERPPQPRYSETWDVSTVTRYIDSLGPNSEITLSDLTHKLTMLLALTRPSRSADLANLNLQFRKYSPEGVTFAPTKLAKQSRQDN